ncbi:MAG: SemiSWEET family transporter [bacterium]|nr:SemiSWEET family transporter [bacterium]
MLGFHHLRSRVLATQGIEPFPARGSWKRFLDYLMYGVSVFAPFALMPQIVSIYRDHQTQGVSLETWVLLTAFSILWTIYGIVHKDKPIIITHSLFMILDGSIVIGILLF